MSETKDCKTRNGMSKIKVGSVVQIDPELSDCFFGGCFMLVTELKSWGAQGFIAIPDSRDEMPGKAYFRAEWDQMMYVGEAAFVLAEAGVDE